jgi:hypothetical protein
MSDAAPGRAAPGRAGLTGRSFALIVVFTLNRATNPACKR